MGAHAFRAEHLRSFAKACTAPAAADQKTRTGGGIVRLRLPDTWKRGCQRGVAAAVRSGGGCLFRVGGRLGHCAQTCSLNRLRALRLRACMCAATARPAPRRGCLPEEGACQGHRRQRAADCQLHRGAARTPVALLAGSPDGSDKRFSDVLLRCAALCQAPGVCTGELGFQLFVNLAGASCGVPSAS